MTSAGGSSTPSRWHTIHSVLRPTHSASQRALSQATPVAATKRCGAFLGLREGAVEIKEYCSWVGEFVSHGCGGVQHEEVCGDAHQQRRDDGVQGSVEHFLSCEQNEQPHKWGNEVRVVGA